MGIPGILKEIGKGDRLALSKLAIDHLEHTNRPLRVAIDAAIWNFQHQASQGGKNPALRTLFFRLLKLLALPINPVFVYDGKNKPLTKRGKTVSRYGSCVENEASKTLVDMFRFPHHVAPGEAEAECALLQRKGVVDAVMSQDVDAIMFGSTLTLRDWSKEGTRGNKTPTHVNAHRLDRVKEDSGLDPDGMILVAMLSGGDYNEAGVAGFGPGLACEVARAGFGSDLLEIVKKDDLVELRAWRERLNYELQTNESGYFRTRRSKLEVPTEFPDMTILGHYTNPVVSEETDLPDLEKKWTADWEAELDVVALRKYTADMFDWNWKSGCRSFIRRLAQPLFQDRLIRTSTTLPPFAADCVDGARQHFTTDGMLELRLAVTSAEVVEVDLEAEEDDPEYAADEAQQVDEEDGLDGAASVENTAHSFFARKPPWNPLAPEKWWVPQTLLQYGLPVIVEEWQQRQRDLLDDPKKFAARKAVKSTKTIKKIDSSVKTNSLHTYLQQASSMKSTTSTSEKSETKSTQLPVSPKRVRNTTPIDKTIPSIAQFFRPQKVNVGSFQESVGQTKGSVSQTEAFVSDGAFFDPNPNESQDTSEANSCELTLHDDKLPRLTPPPSSADDAEVERHLVNVTQRRKRGVKSPLKAASNDGQSVLQKDDNRAIVDSRDVEAELSTEVKGPAVTEILSQMVVAGSQCSIVSRDSLPGTWTKTQPSSAKKRSRRVTHIDLTGD